MNPPTHLFNSIASVQRHGYVDHAGDTEYVEKLSFSIPCRVQVLSGEDAIRAGGDRTKLVAKMYCAPTVDIRNEDHVTCEGITYYDIVVREPDYMSAYKVVEMQAPLIERADQ